MALPPDAEKIRSQSDLTPTYDPSFFQPVPENLTVAAGVSPFAEQNVLPTEEEIAATRAELQAAVKPPADAAPLEPASVKPPAAEAEVSTLRRTHEGVPIIRMGMSEEDQQNPEVQAAIKNWQRELKQKGLLEFEGEPSGVFDETLNEATRKYQEAYGLAVDGVVGGQTWRKQKEVEGKALPSAESPAPATVVGAGAAAAAMPADAQGGPTVSAEQRAEAIQQIQDSINAEFERQNHTINPKTGQHQYSFAYLGGAPEIPEIIQDAIKNEDTHQFNVTQPDGSVKPVPFFLQDGTLNPEFKKEMTNRALDGRLDEAAQRAEQAKQIQAEQVRQNSPEVATQQLQEMRAELVDKIEAKLETSADGKRYGLAMMMINIPSDIKEALSKNGVYAYKDESGQNQSIDFTVKDGKALEAEMKELSGMVKTNGQNVDFDGEAVSNYNAAFKNLQQKIDTGQGR